MKTFLRQQLEQFLEAVDAALERPVEVVVIGGSAAALQYGVSAATRDIETWTNVGAALARAAETARSTKGLEVPLQKSGVFFVVMPGTGERGTTRQDSLPAVPRRHGLAEDVRVLVGVQPIRRRAFSPQLQEKRLSLRRTAAQLEDPAVGLAGIREGLALGVCDLEKPLSYSLEASVRSPSDIQELRELDAEARLHEEDRLRRRP